MSGGLYYESMLHNYILGMNSGRNLPKALKNDVLVEYVRRRIQHGYCPFCGRGFPIRRGLIIHLSLGHHQCKQNLDEFIRLTVDRYLLIRSEKLKEYIKPSEVIG